MSTKKTFLIKWTDDFEKHKVLMEKYYCILLMKILILIFTKNISKLLKSFNIANFFLFRTFQLEKKFVEAKLHFLADRGSNQKVW